MIRHSRTWSLSFSCERCRSVQAPEPDDLIEHGHRRLRLDLGLPAQVPNSLSLIDLFGAHDLITFREVASHQSLGLGAEIESSSDSY